MFDWKFYINYYKELNLKTDEEALLHWINFGKKEGRLGCNNHSIVDLKLTNNEYTNNHYLKIKFKLDNDIYSIKYRLYNNSITDKFIKIINYNNSNNNAITQYTNLCINVGDINEIKKNKYDELIINIDLFEKENNNNITFKHKFSFDQLNQYNLNNLHTEFETYILRFTQSDVLTNIKNLKNQDNLINNCNMNNIVLYLNNINNIIHNLEDVIGCPNNSTYSSGYYSSYLYSEPYIKPILIDSNEYELFTIEHSWGDLLLGYGTTGKSLFHLFKDDDIKLLKDGFNLSPQEYVTSNILGIFKNTPESYEDDFKKWFDNNNINSSYGIDFNDKKNASGYIKFGKIIYDGDKEELLNKLSKCTDIIGYEIR
jgi:hypothetical protein